jgi:PST family polysaccharide transporter
LALVEGLDEAVKESARGSLLLMVGQVVSTLVSALTIMIVARLLGPENYGVVTVVMVPIGLALLIQDLGVNSALTRFTAHLRREGRPGDVRVLVRVGITFKAAVAGTIALGYWAGAGVKMRPPRSKRLTPWKRITGIFILNGAPRQLLIRD